MEEAHGCAETSRLDTDAYVDSVKRHAAEFTRTTGLDIEFRVIPSDVYFSNDIHAFLDGEERADLYMSGPVLLWDHVGRDFVEPLDPFLKSADAESDIKDFFGSRSFGTTGVEHVDLVPRDELPLPQ